MKTVASSVRQAILSVPFALGALAIAVVLLLACAEQFFTAVNAGGRFIHGFHGALIYSAVQSDAMSFFIPIVCALPCAAAYVDDLKTGYVKLYLSRTSRGGYILGKIAGCALSGGLVLLTGIVLAYLVAAVLLLPMEARLEEGMQATAWFLMIVTERGGMIFLSAAFWALLGMTLSAASESRYIAYASPFIFYYLLIILYERYFNKLYILYPKEWISVTHPWPFGKAGAAVFVLELIALTALFFAFLAHRRISRL